MLTGRDDYTRKLLMNVLPYGPFLIKPNNHELGEIFGVELKDKDEIITYATRGMEPMRGFPQFMESVEKLQKITLNDPTGPWVDEFYATVPVNLFDSDNIVATINLTDNFVEQETGSFSPAITSVGTYKLKIPAGTFHIDGVGNAEQSFTWTVVDHKFTETKLVTLIMNTLRKTLG